MLSLPVPPGGRSVAADGLEAQLAMRAGADAGSQAMDEARGGFLDAIEYVRGLTLSLAGVEGFIQAIGEHHPIHADVARAKAEAVADSRELLTFVADQVREQSWRIAQTAYHDAYVKAHDAVASGADERSEPEAER